MEIIKDNGTAVYVGYIYRHWIINDKEITKSYIGKTINKPISRWHQDGSGYKDNKENSTVFWNAIQKYGWDNFKHEIVLKIECQDEDELHFWLNQFECYYIWYYDSYYKNNKGYNMTFGGDGVAKGTEPWNKGKENVYSEETLQKMSENRKGKCVGDKNGFYGRKHTDDSKKQMSISQKKLYENGYVNPSLGLKRSDESKIKMSEAQKKRMANKENNPMYGKKHAEETKTKIRDSRVGKYCGEDNPFYGMKHTEETKKKISDSLKGRKPNEETRIKLSNARKGENNPKAKAVICLNNKQVFSTAKEAKEWCGGNVTHCCLNRIKSAGKHPETGEKLKWMYYDEYLKLKEEDDNKNGKY